MHIDIHAVNKLRGPKPVNCSAPLGSVLDAVVSSDADLSRFRVVCDWIQYRSNFREPVMCRPVLAERPGASGPSPGDPQNAEPALELAVDVRRGGDIDVPTCVKKAIAETTGPGGLVLEPWGPMSKSCIWKFNALYWQALASWEEATGREYEQALPGGESDGRNREAVRDSILELFRIWDDLEARRALPAELYVLELGVGNGNQARTWLDTFTELDRVHGRDYYRRLYYFMADYSPHVLERARRTAGRHGEHVNSFVLDATRPELTLGFLRGKAFLVYISNVYDNLPADEIATILGRPYEVEVCAFLPEEETAEIARRYRTPASRLPALVARLLRLGPELLAEAQPDRFPDMTQAVLFWRDVWGGLRLKERYVPLDGLGAYQVTPSLTGEVLRPLLGACGDTRMQVSTGALASFAGTLPLLHPFGRLQCHDLFISEPGQYRTGFYGPGKYDGSVVNWVNGPLLQLTGNRRGFDVQIAPFSARPASNVKTLTAQVRD